MDNLTKQTRKLKQGRLVRNTGKTSKEDSEDE
jgi:hypothetical protein